MADVLGYVVIERNGSGGKSVLPWIWPGVEIAKEARITAEKLTSQRRNTYTIAEVREIEAEDASA